MASGHIDDREPSHPDGQGGFGEVLHPDAPVVRPTMLDHIAHLFDKFASRSPGERRCRPYCSRDTAHVYLSDPGVARRATAYAASRSSCSLSVAATSALGRKMAII